MEEEPGHQNWTRVALLTTAAVGTVAGAYFVVTTGLAVFFFFFCFFLFLFLSLLKKVVCAGFHGRWNQDHRHRDVYGGNGAFLRRFSSLLLFFFFIVAFLAGGRKGVWSWGVCDQRRRPV
jgi:hypothetical protein